VVRYAPVTRKSVEKSATMAVFGAHRETTTRGVFNSRQAFNSLEAFNSLQLHANCLRLRFAHFCALWRWVFFPNPKPQILHDPHIHRRFQGPWLYAAAHMTVLQGTSCGWLDLTTCCLHWPSTTLNSGARRAHHVPPSTALATCRHYSRCCLSESPSAPAGCQLG
jgi:hypothetical protein